MKLILPLFALLLVPHIAFSTPSADRLLLSPAQPHTGETMTIVYHPSESSAFFRAAAELTLDALLVTDEGSAGGTFRQLPMVKEGGEWKASLKIEDRKTHLILFRVVSGDSVDDNDKNVWASMVWDNDGRPLPGAHTSLSRLYQYGIASFSRGRDPEFSKKELLEELALYPENRTAAFLLWGQQLGNAPSDSIKTVLRPMVERFYEREKSNDSLAAAYPAWYERLGDSAKARAIRADGAARFPAGKVALESRIAQLASTKDPEKLVALNQKILLDFPQLTADERQMRLASLLRWAIQAKNLDVAVDALTKMPKPSYNNFTQVAGKLMGAGVRLDDAERFAKKAVDMTAVPDENDRRYYRTTKEWKESADYDKAASLQVYTEALIKNGKAGAAESAIAAAYDLVKGDDAEIGQLYVQTLALNKKYQAALLTGWETVRKGKGTDSLIADLQRAFAAKEGTPSFDALSVEKKKEFSDALGKAHDELVAMMRKKVLATRISKPAADFTLNDLRGTPVTLSSLKGNVVILDFWATWCNPCKISFPYLKKVYDKYRDNPKVTFLAVDCWERFSEYAAILENAKKFQADNKYSWTVLVDGKSEVATLYEVEGIPTKFIIGEDGKIAFTSIGFNGPDMEEELTQQIEILLAEPAGGTK